MLGQSYEGEDIHLLTITNKATGTDTEKPAVWLDANIHATEIAGTTTTLRIVWELLSKYGSDEKVTRLVDTSTFYAVPRLNPDGAAWAIADKPKFVRSGVRLYPYEEKMDSISGRDGGRAHPFHADSRPPRRMENQHRQPPSSNDANPTNRAGNTTECFPKG